MTDALECYECFDVAEVNVSIPGNPQLEESIKLAYQLMADPDCRLRDRVGATVERHTCDPFTEPDQANWRHVCSSGDIRTRMITNYDISGLKCKLSSNQSNQGSHSHGKSWKILEKMWSSESYGKVMENSKNSEFHGNLFARKKKSC